MKSMSEYQDAFGHALLDQLEGRAAGEEIIERDDGYIALSAPASRYFEPPDQTDRAAIDHATGRVLDIGCGAGRIAIYLQQRGCDVVAIDISPRAVQVSRMRGVADAQVMDIRDISRKELGRFDAFVMMGNNFGLLASEGRARRLLRRFARMANDGALIIAQTLDPYLTQDELHRAYHEQNRTRGRMAGQVRMRARYKIFKTQWFDYLFVSRSELADLVAGTGWKLRDVIDTDSAVYNVVMEKHR